MRDRASATAAWVAGWRGLGRLLGDQCLADDALGAHFGGRWAVALARAGHWRPARAALMRVGQIANWVGYMQVRTRLIDDQVLDFVAGGGRQVVILGAGYDCRAARFAAPLAGARVFEVDHPATQARKREVLARLGVTPTVDYLAWDFERRSAAALPEALAGRGLDRDRPTAIVWEGVTMYLSEGAIEATVAAAHRLGGDGSRLVFNYLVRELLERPRGLARTAAVVVRGLGEPFRFGWDPAALPAWLAARGWQLRADHDCDRAARRLLPPRVAGHVAAFGRRIAVAGRA